MLVHVIKRISNEFSFHTMYYETRCVFYIPSPEARGYKTHSSFHNTSYGMKIHLRSYIYPLYSQLIRATAVEREGTIGLYSVSPSVGLSVDVLSHV